MKKIISLLCLFFVCVISQAQIGSINFGFTLKGFLCDGKEYIVLNYPNVSEQDLYTRILKGYFAYKDNLYKGGFLKEIGGKEIDISFRVADSDCRWTVKSKYQFKDGKIRISIQGELFECWDGWDNRWISLDWNDEMYNFFERRYFKKPKSKRKKELEALNSLMNNIIIGIVTESEKVNPKAEEDW